MSGSGSDTDQTFLYTYSARTSRRTSARPEAPNVPRTQAWHPETILDTEPIAGIARLVRRFLRQSDILGPSRTLDHVYGCSSTKCSAYPYIAPAVNPETICLSANI
jgi:hypothetical protein